MYIIYIYVLFYNGLILSPCVQSFPTLVIYYIITGQVGLGVGSWPSNRATEGLNPKGTRLYFVILLKNVEKIFDWH